MDFSALNCRFADMPYDFRSSIAAHHAAIDSVASLELALRDVIARVRRTFEQGQRVFACGNGGSAADAQHFAAEFTGRYENDRRAYPAIALTTDTSALTSIGNDYGFERVFTRQLQALAHPGDLLLAISTSGSSPNVKHAVEYCKGAGIYTVGLLGRDGGVLSKLVDAPLVVGAQRTPRIQEAHIFILHMICEAFEEDA